MKFLTNIATGTAVLIGATFVVVAIFAFSALDDLCRLGEKTRSRK